MLKNILNRVANSLEKSKAFFVELFDKHVEFGHVILLSHLLAKSTLCFKYVHKKKSKGFKSGNRESYVTGPLHPIYLWPNIVFKCSLTLRIKLEPHHACTINNLSAKGVDSKNWDNVHQSIHQKIEISSW